MMSTLCFKSRAEPPVFFLNVPPAGRLVTCMAAKALTHLRFQIVVGLELVRKLLR